MGTIEKEKAGKNGTEKFGIGTEKFGIDPMSVLHKNKSMLFD